MTDDQWVFATHNTNKLSEIRALFNGHNLPGIKGLDEIGFYREIPETAETLEGNAAIKAETILEHTGKACFSDDTGLEVKCLGGAPGVFSARYAGPRKDSAANIAKLLEEMEGCKNREARFKSVIAFAQPGEETLFFEGTAEGEILEQPQGQEGFGYDPVFKPSGSTRSFAEMPLEKKNRISHRARALRSFLEAVEQMKGHI